jgi:hypothetical protein
LGYKKALLYAAVRHYTAVSGQAEPCLVLAQQQNQGQNKDQFGSSSQNGYTAQPVEWRFSVNVAEHWKWRQVQSCPRQSKLVHGFIRIGIIARNGAIEKKLHGY